MSLYDFSFYDLINRNAVSFPNKVAWIEVDDQRTLTFMQYKEQVDHLTFGLKELGIGHGDRIAILGKNNLEYFLIYGAAAALGAIVVPINWRLSAEEVAFNVKDCEPRILFVGRDFEDLTQGLQRELKSIDHYYNLSQKAGIFTDFTGLLDNSGIVETNSILGDDGFVIIHTAAAAGRPRGALLSHNNLLLGNLHFDYLFDLRETDVHLNFLPLFHVGGLFMATMCFHAGGTTLNMSGFDADLAVKLIEERKVTILMEFSPILSSILEIHEKTGRDISSLQKVAGIDSPEPIEKYQKLTGGTFYCLYGQTETSSMATVGRYNDRPGSAGKTIAMAHVKLVDDEDHTVETGQAGEIAIKGPLVFKGYWNLPEDTAHAFRGGWHHTGDLGRFDEDGFLWYMGRKPEKELIKPGGENVYPAEVEKVILEHPSVEKTVVIGVPDPKWKEGIKAVCLLKEGEVLEPNALIDFVGKRIARYKKPQYVEFVSDLPLKEDGSPDRAKIKERYGGQQ